MRKLYFEAQYDEDVGLRDVVAYLVPEDRDFNLDEAEFAARYSNRFTTEDLWFGYLDELGYERLEVV